MENDFPRLLENVPLNFRKEPWFQQGGAPPYYHRVVRDYLDETFANKWIGRGSVNAWPPRSPDLTPLDFFLWGVVKEQVYQSPIRNCEDLKTRIRNACAQ